MLEINRAKGVALKSPDIKIIMNACTPLNKVSGSQGSKIFVGGIVLSQFLSYLNPSNPMSQILYLEAPPK